MMWAYNFTTSFCMMPAWASCIISSVLFAMFSHSFLLLSSDTREDEGGHNTIPDYSCNEEKDSVVESIHDYNPKWRSSW
jgi:hypothetical protein